MTDPTPPPADDRGPVTRRAFLGAAGTTAAALTLAACGSAGRPRPTARATATTTTTASSHEVAQVTPPPFASEPDLRPPSILVHRRPSDPGQELFVFTDAHAGTGQQGPMIIDRAGRLRWFLPVSDDGTATRRVTNLRVQTYRGEPVLTYWIGGLVGAHGAGHYEIYDQRYRKVAEVQAGAGLQGDLHEFTLTPQGTALLTAYGEATGAIPDADGPGTHQGAYYYCCAQEVDVATGRLLLNWRSDEHVPFSASRRLPVPTDPKTPWDYFHMNSVQVDPSDGNLIVSSRNLWQIYKVARRSGRTMWRMGGTGSDFAVPRRARFAFQHHVTPHGDGVYTIFDNEAGPPAVRPQSRGLVLHVDERRRRVRLSRQLHHRPPILSDALGSVQLLAADGVFVGWGESSYFTEYDARGGVVLDAHLSGGVVSYRAFEEAWSGAPTQPPKVVVTPHGSGATLYVSWNGATVHRRWSVLGGSEGASMQQIASVPVDGFEAAVHLQSPPRQVMVQALDANGDVVAHSAVVTTGA